MTNSYLMVVADDWLNSQREDKKREMLQLLLTDFLPELPGLEKKCEELKAALERTESEEMDIDIFVQGGRARLAAGIREELLAPADKLLEERAAATAAAREAFARVARLVAGLKAVKKIDEEWAKKHARFHRIEIHPRRGRPGLCFVVRAG